MSSRFSTRRSFLKAAGLAAASLTIGAPRLTAREYKKPNILMILVDDLGYGDLSSYGASDLKTPAIDSLVSAGMRFDNFYANCPVCSPTRAALLTGRYPDMAGVPGVIRTHIASSWGYMDPRTITLPTVLKDCGYRTACIGKWHLGLSEQEHPNRRGFDHFKGFLGDMMDDYYNHKRHGFDYMYENEKPIDPEGHATDLFTQWSADYITKAAKSDKPWFLYLAYNAPHTPIQPPKDWLEKVRKREEGIDNRRARLVALIEHMDAGIGKVIEALNESGDADNTLIVFTSDNGGQSNVGANNGPLTGGKQQMFEGGIKVAACAVWPGRIKPGSRSDRLALTMDLYPTFCEAAGAQIDYPIDGRSILPTLLGKNQPPEDRTVFWMRREGGRYAGRIYYAARYGSYKLLQNSPFEPMILVNLEEDPLEQNPLPTNHPMYKKLTNDLKGHITESGAVPWQKYPVNLDNKYTHDKK